LPFSSHNEGDVYFTDGLTEDIISSLGRSRELSVISLGGVSTYKGSNPNPEEVGRDLQVRYVVEGSVRRSPERIRVSVNLTDTARSTLLWSEQYDVKPEDIFSVQDRITQQISGALAVQVTGVELAQSAAKPPNNLEAYDLVLRGRDAFSRITRSGNAEAREFFRQAMQLDPSYAPALVGLANVDLKAVTQGWTPNPGEALERAETLARKAIELDQANPRAHAVLGNVAVYFGEYDRGLRELNRAIELNPSDAEAYGGLIGVLLWTGNIEGAISAGELLRQFQPNLTATESFHLATAYLLANQSAEAIRVLEEALDRNRADPFAHVILAAAYAEQGRDEEARQQAGVVRQRSPGFSRAEFGSLLRDQAQRQKLALALEKAGL
jgi:TolB-like protein/Tfp pilus assembly protein PilF